MGMERVMSVHLLHYIPRAHQRANGLEKEMVNQTMTMTSTNEHNKLAHPWYIRLQKMLLGDLIRESTTWTAKLAASTPSLALS